MLLKIYYFIFEFYKVVLQNKASIKFKQLNIMWHKKKVSYYSNEIRNNDDIYSIVNDHLDFCRFLT